VETTLNQTIIRFILFTLIIANNLFALSIKEFDEVSKKDDANFISDMQSSYPEIISLIDEMKLDRVESSDGDLSLILPTTWSSIKGKSPIAIDLNHKSAKLTVSKINISLENLTKYKAENILTIYAMSLVGKNAHIHNRFRVIKSGKRVMTSIHIVEKNDKVIMEHYYTMQIIKNHIYLIGVSVNPTYEQLGKFLSELALYSLWTKEVTTNSKDLVTNIEKPQISLAIDLDNERAIDIRDTIPSNREKIYASTTTYRAFADEVLTIKWYAYIDNNFTLIKEESRDLVGSEFIYSYLEYSKGNFPIGRYRVVFSLGEYETKVKDFTIVDSAIKKRVNLYR